MEVETKIDVLEQAIHIAVTYHMGQRDRSNRPYILHPLRVMHKLGGQVKDHPYGDLILSAAVLHDVVEDTTMTLEGLYSAGMPSRVVHIVDLLTHTKEDGRTYREYIERLAPDPDACRIKIADLNDNLFHPARREGWKGHEGSKRRYLGAWFYLEDGVWQ